MIPTSAHAGITATRRRSRILSALLAVLVLIGIVVAAPAHAQTTPTPSPTASGEVEFAVAPASNGVLTSGAALTVQFSVQNGTALRVPADDATLQLGDAPLGDRAALAAWLDGTATADTGRQVGATRIETVIAGDTATGSLQVPADDEALVGRQPGVYPLRLVFGGREARSVIVVPGSAAAPVGVIVPVTAGPLERGLLTRAQLETLTGTDGSLTAILDAVEGTAAILAIDPAVPAAIRVLGTSAPASAQEWLTRLLQLPNSRFALQFGDADVATQIDAGLASPWQPTSLTAYVDASSVPDPTATPTTPAPGQTEGDADAPVLPDLATLLDIGNPAAPRIYWPVSGSAGPSVVSTLAASVPGAVTVLDSAAVTPADSGASSGRATAGDAGLLLTDHAVSSTLLSASVEGDGATRQALLAAASADLTLAAAASGGSALLVTVDRANDRTRAGLRGAIDAASVPGLTVTGLDGILGAEARAVTVADAPSDADRVSAIGPLSDGADRIARFATILDDPNLLTGPERASILQLLGAGWQSGGADWATAYANHRAATEETLAAVGILPSSPLNLLTAGTDLRFWVHNDLPYPVNVVLDADPNDLRLEIDRQTVVLAAASSNTPVAIPVRARIGNGDVKIVLSLRSPSSEPIGSPQTVDVNVRADWEAYGTAILATLIVGFLVLGVVRTVRRRRRARATGTGIDATDGAADAPAADAPDAVTDDAASVPEPPEDRS
ncbi:DUF6049 family protein [Microbacterium sp. cx-59]|uniref:DUF6049 family protein n=1 Tax=Microbacterium sp. cx-59 TaxID=2891207 RepID=UPI001E4F110B|nr:DUF6049 family protein [Microbacterium sp. cx-59]MCC4908707.1 DUF6049 family protein [Microbacterium sp. cx-59]